MNKRPLLITCVAPERPHPSGRMAAKLCDEGFDVRLLFENAGSPKALLHHARTLSHVLDKGDHDRAVINVNGSIAQALALCLCRLNGLSTTLWIMDSYPGCLRYVTPLWWLFYPVFFVASVVAKALADHVLVIDEAFVAHVPSWPAFRRKCVYTPLPQTQAHEEITVQRVREQSDDLQPVIGILGHIEKDWLAKDFPLFYKDARRQGFRIIVATSNPVDTRMFETDGVDYVVPWPKSETDRVFEQCDAVLVPLSSSRLIYSSPSKIIDCYRRGIQPVVMTNKADWDSNRSRNIYRKCIHLSEFFSERKKHSISDLLAYSEHWTKSSYFDAC